MHPNAYLRNVRNVSCGLKARSKILQILDNNPSTAARIAVEAALTYNVVGHHLRLLENEAIVQRKGGRPYYWLATGLGQKRLVS
jgi:predicted transcriptional regulator